MSFFLIKHSQIPFNLDFNLNLFLILFLYKDQFILIFRKLEHVFLVLYRIKITVLQQCNPQVVDNVNVDIKSFRILFYWNNTIHFLNIIMVNS